MGALYTIILLDEPCAEWLRTDGITCPEPLSTARLPTPREIKTVLSGLSGFHADITADAISGGWSAFIESNNPATPGWTELRLSNYSDEDQSCDFYFSKGNLEVIFAVVEQLTGYCGPLVVVDDSACHPVVVSPGDSISELLGRSPAD